MGESGMGESGMGEFGMGEPVPDSPGMREEDILPVPKMNAMAVMNPRPKTLKPNTAL
jgi:hypothetical protein